MTRWYRRYCGTVNDPKLAEIAVAVSCSKSVVIATWDALLEGACEAEADGAYVVTARRIAAMLGEPVATIDAILVEMTALGMIANGALCNWSRRQFTSDSSTERSRKFREKRRHNVAATAMQRCATVPDTESETDKDNTSPPHIGAARERVGVSEPAESVQHTETEIKHRAFVIALPAIEMLVLRAGLSRPEVKQRCLAHALQWAAEIDAGKLPRDVLPQKIANFLAASLMGEHNRDARPVHRANGRPMPEAARRTAHARAVLRAMVDKPETVQ